MKKIRLITLLTLFTTLSFSQENPKLKIHSLGVGFGFFVAEYKFSGLCSLLDCTIEYDKNLLSLNYLDGSEISIDIFYSSPKNHVNELNLQYGRELKVTNWFSVESFAGIGNYRLNTRLSFFPLPKTSVISIPIRVKLLFYTGKGKHFAISSNNNYSINKLNSNFSSNLTFQYNF